MTVSSILLLYSWHHSHFGLLFKSRLQGRICMARTGQSPHRALWLNSSQFLSSGSSFPRSHKSHPLLQPYSVFRQAPVPWIQFFSSLIIVSRHASKVTLWLDLIIPKDFLVTSSISFLLIHCVQIHHNFHSWVINFHLNSQKSLY